MKNSASGPKYAVSPKPGRLEIGLGLARDPARVARVRLARDRILDVADQHERRMIEERIDERGLRIRDHQHVALVDRLPTADRRAVEAHAVFERALVDLADRIRAVLPLTREIREAKIDDLHVVLLGELEHLFGGHSEPSSIVRSGGSIPRRRTPGGADSNERDTGRLDGAGAALAGADADRLFDASTKILPSPIRPVLAASVIAATALSASSSATTSSILILGRKSTDVLGAAIELGVPFWRPKPFTSVHGHALDADALECLLHLVELERLDDRFDLLHGPIS
jgi:hypothetical protein